MTRVESSAYPSRGEPAFAVTLGALAREIPNADPVDATAGATRITGVHHDSRRVEPGDLFVARAGARTSGESHVEQAIARGAAAILVGRGSEIDTRGLPTITASEVPRALAFAAAAVYGHPTFGLDVVGITGTNGKTTTAHLVQAAIDGAGGHAGIVGTLGYRFGDLDIAATHTSPEADDLARVALAMKARGASHLVMEVSSIALAARRADAVRFRVAAFTNLTQDHLDYHSTMEGYAEAKARLFSELGPGAAVVNVDDPFGRELARRLAPGVPLARFTTSIGAAVEAAEIAPTALSTSKLGIELRARTPAGEVSIRSPLVGMHNVENLLCALGIGWALDLDVARVAQALSADIRVPGRLERCDGPGDDVTVLVDYAHTPDALARVLKSVRALGAGAVRCVFGCGGDRDPLKRPQMGAVVARGADLAIVTSDNPRSEAPEAIVAEILPGLVGGTAEVIVELDRRRAIERAVLEARPGDLVLVAGKGHETYQILGKSTVAFDDRSETRRALQMRREGRG